MNVIGLGTDIVECARIQRMIHRHGEHFLNRVYTSKELQACQSKAQSVERLAERWAAKEAILKCLGSMSKGVSWLDIEVQEENFGKAVVALRGSAREQALRLRIHDIHLSISHCKAYATAYALAVGAKPL